MFLFVGLGNKGESYKKTRHNVGFFAIDTIFETLSLDRKEDVRFSSIISNFKYQGVKVICIKPQTFMNLSGRAVLEVMKFYKIPLQNVFVFHDDIDLELAKIKFKIGGGAGGHNGIKSIDEMVGRDYVRVRIGVDRPPEKVDVSNYVLSNFEQNEILVIEKNLKIIFNHLEILLSCEFSSLSQMLENFKK